jgi:hypothetical protein
MLPLRLGTANAWRVGWPGRRARLRRKAGMRRFALRGMRYLKWLRRSHGTSERCGCDCGHQCQREGVGQHEFHPSLMHQCVSSLGRAKGRSGSWLVHGCCPPVAYASPANRHAAVHEFAFAPATPAETLNLRPLPRSCGVWVGSRPCPKPVLDPERPIGVLICCAAQGRFGSLTIW